jgi:hypothetical protein
MLFALCHIPVPGEVRITRWTPEAPDRFPFAAALGAHAKPNAAMAPIISANNMVVAAAIQSKAQTP